MTTPLHTAVRNNQIQDIINLINGRANVNAKDAERFTPLHAALLNENVNVDILNLLLTAGADVNVKSGYKGERPIHFAVRTNNLDIVKLLVTAGADIHSKNKDKQRPLHIVCQEYDKNGKICKFLLEAGAEVDAKDTFHHTPLHYAVVNCHEFIIIELLLKAGANINAQSICESTPLHKAFDSFNLNIVKFLLDAGANPKLKNDEGDTPLYASLKEAYSGVSVNLLKLMVEAGVDVNEYNEDGESALSLLIRSLENNRKDEREIIEESIRYLIEYSNVNLTNKKRKNILNKTLKSSDLKKYRKHFYKIVIEHIAKLKALNLEADEEFLNTFEKINDYQNYFAICTAELEKAKTTRLRNCWVTLFHLLVDQESKFVKYAGNKNLIEDFEDNVENFPIYGTTMQSNVKKGISGRKAFDGAANTLSYYSPIFDPFHLIIRDILNTLCEDDWNKLCKRKRMYESN